MVQSWVKNRAACSLDIMWDALTEQISFDVQERDDCTKVGDPFVFAVSGNAEHILVEAISRAKPDVTAFCVRFIKSNVAVRIESPDSETLLAYPVYNTQEGACMFSVGGQYFEVWELSKRCLEKLFFEFRPIQ